MKANVREKLYEGVGISLRNLMNKYTALQLLHQKSTQVLKMKPGALAI